MEAQLNPAQRLHALGQSLWLDSINRVMLRTGVLARYVRDLAVTGLTSNPRSSGMPWPPDRTMTARWPAWRAKVSLMLRTWCTPWRWRT